MTRLYSYFLPQGLSMIEVNWRGWGGVLRLPGGVRKWVRRMSFWTQKLVGWGIQEKQKSSSCDIWTWGVKGRIESRETPVFCWAFFFSFCCCFVATGWAVESHWVRERVERDQPLRGAAPGLAPEALFLLILISCSIYMFAFEGHFPSVPRSHLIH